MDLLFLGLALLGLAAGISVIDRFRRVSWEQDEMTEALIRPLDESSCEPGPVSDDRPSQDHRDNCSATSTAS